MNGCEGVALSMELIPPHLLAMDSSRRPIASMRTCSVLMTTTLIVNAQIGLQNLHWIHPPQSL